MLPLERQKIIIDFLMKKKVMKMHELTNILGVSMDTLRRDLQQLIKQGRVKKIYGGVEFIEPLFNELPMGERMISQLQEKKAIAQACSDLISDGDCIFLDSGSTTYQIAKHIKNKKKLTVITNSIPIVLELLHSDVDVVIIGGKVRKEEQSVFSHDYLFHFDSLNIQKAFICAGGISIEKGISDYNIDEIVTRKKVIGLANSVFIACDSTKFGKDVLVGIAPLSAVDYIITDDQIPNYLIREFSHTSTELIVAKTKKEAKVSLHSYKRKQQMIHH